MDSKRFSLYEYHSMFSEDIQMSYKGPFDKHILSLIGNYIKIIISNNPKASKKLFNIFIELAQNISYYSAETNRIGQGEAGLGTLVIGEFDDHYTFVTGNVVRNDDVIPLINKCEKINSLDRDGLRKYKRELRKLPHEGRDGANIGLIKVALTSANPLDIEVTPIDNEFSFFALSVKVKK